jgi:hypothetical protein
MFEGFLENQTTVINSVIQTGLGIGLAIAALAFAFAPTLIAIASRSILWILFVLVLNCLALFQVLHSVITFASALVTAITALLSTILWFASLFVAGLGAIIRQGQRREEILKQQAGRLYDIDGRLYELQLHFAGIGDQAPPATKVARGTPQVASVR